MINVITAANDKYIKYLLVMLQSLFENNDCSICVYILTSGLSEKETSLLNSVETKKNGIEQKIVILNVKKELLGDVDTREFSIETYFRLFMFDLLPSTINRVLYLDVDIIINRSIYDLYNSNFKEHAIIACSNGLSYEEMAKAIDEDRLIPRKGECFNAGVVLYNLEKIRKKGLTFNDFKSVLEDPETYYDQGVINHYFWDDAIYVDTELYNNRGWNKNFDFRNSYIIHYAAGNPWELKLTGEELAMFDNYSILEEKRKYYLNDYYMKMVDLWWEYAKKTIIFEQLKKESEIINEYFITRIIKTFIEPFEREHHMLHLHERLLCKDSLIGIGQLLKAKKIERCAIYGMGHFGRIVYKMMCRDGIEVAYYIDIHVQPDIDLERRSMDCLDHNIPVIVCLGNKTEDIKNRLRCIADVKAYDLNDLLGG